MALREDFRNALAAIAATVPDATHTMRHGENESGAIVQSSSRDFADPVSESGPAQAARFIANAALFPTLEIGAAVELDGSLRVVVSLNTDPIGATLAIGLSPEFEKCPAAYSGTRRENGGSRQIKHPLDILLLESGTADNFSGALAPTYATAYVVAIRRADWPEASAPEISDSLAVLRHAACGELALKVSSVTRHGGWYILKCRTRS